MLCWHFLSYSNQAMTKIRPLVVMVMWFAYVIWTEFLLKKILQKAAPRPTKVFFSFYKWVSGRNSDHEWLRIANAFILCDLVWKVQKSHAANREGSFNISVQWTSLSYLTEKEHQENIYIFNMFTYMLINPLQ